MGHRRDCCLGPSSSWIDAARPSFPSCSSSGRWGCRLHSNPPSRPNFGFWPLGRRQTSTNRHKVLGANVATCETSPRPSGERVRCGTPDPPCGTSHFLHAAPKMFCEVSRDTRPASPTPRIMSLNHQNANETQPAYLHFVGLGTRFQSWPEVVTPFPFPKLPTTNYH